MLTSATTTLAAVIVGLRLVTGIMDIGFAYLKRRMNRKED